ncbi:Phosphatidylinositol (PI) 3-kinase [Entomophthora muscae]|uniref:Phosphatidylinositol (PI) 3-kinase n=1 Tax=Entomophthora muscae TaxID=34485 RepID=A0ACC2UAU3_9FUNG|nr:Phosphatidylinositol (PI) 3-kinase [Entomophthora muscae]
MKNSPFLSKSGTFLLTLDWWLRFGISWVHRNGHQSLVLLSRFFLLTGTTIKLRRGRQKLYLWPDKEGDSSAKCSTPAKPEGYDEIDRLEKLQKKQEAGDIPKVDWLDKLAVQAIDKIREKEIQKTNKLHLYIELPKFNFPLVFHETEASLPKGSSFRSTSSGPLGITAAVVDLEMFKDNLVEAKHRRLVRSHRADILDKELKPNADHRDHLNTVLKYPPARALTAEEKDLLWKFRFYLTQNKKALTKFLKGVVWSDPLESSQAAQLLESWAPVDVDDAIELLGPEFQNAAVRAYAVCQLQKACDDDLLLYLLQLVQALKFEQKDVQSSLQDSLAEFLIKRALKNPVLASRFFWYIKVERGDKKYGEVYSSIDAKFRRSIRRLPDGTLRLDALERQGQLVDCILNLARGIRQSKDPLFKKIEKLQNQFHDTKHGLHSLLPVPLPLDANVTVTGVVAEKCSIFKSNLLPIKLVFQTEAGDYPLMFKHGDDLRQDQLVIQIIMLMDNLMRKENLDLKLTPYKVLATGPDQGMIQFVPSQALASILQSSYSSLLAFLQQNNPDATAPLGVSPVVMDNYLRSCAGYCVITYLLGVGDRHLDNLMLTDDGRLFHIDFGYFLGRDPKPFPPPMKLCKEMIEAMGGSSSVQYTKFLTYCFVAFNSLRKSSSLILNLLSLMLDANIPDIAIEPDKAVMKVQEKFCLELTDEEANQHLRAIIQESVSALFPQVIETIHKWAQYWRK